jgi:hypothetical protein
MQELVCVCVCVLYQNDESTYCVSTHVKEFLGQWSSSSAILLKELRTIMLLLELPTTIVVQQVETHQVVQERQRWLTSNAPAKTRSPRLWSVMTKSSEFIKSHDGELSQSTTSNWTDDEGQGCIMCAHRGHSAETCVGTIRGTKLTDRKRVERKRL